MAATKDSTASISSPPASPTSPTPSIASSTGFPTPKVQDKKLFMSNLQVLLKKQDNELVKNIEFKKKVEEGDPDEEENHEEDSVFEDTVESNDNRKENKDKVTDKEKAGMMKTAEDKAKEGKRKEEETCKKPKKSSSEAKENKTNKKTTGDNKKDAKKDKAKETKDKLEVSKKPRRMTPPESPRTPKEDRPPIEDDQTKKDKEETKKKKNAKETENNNNKDNSRDDDQHKQEEPRPNDDESRDQRGKIESVEESKTGIEDDKKLKEEKKEKARQDIPPPSSSNASSPLLSVSSASSTDPKKNKEEEMKVVKKEKQQGTLMKKGSSPFSLWKKYYFVLDGKLLMYYRSENDYKGLVGAKGSLDLALLEEIRIKKPGRMKVHFPFAVSRRNLKNINLATETEDDREKWMSILRGTLEHPNRLSGSENILNTSDSPVAEAKQEKYATLPVRTSTASRSEISSGESGGEEPVLIQPKKVGRVGIGMNLDLNAIKLKKIDEPRKQEEERASEVENKVEGGNVFGVKLKKSIIKGVAVENTIDGKEDGKAPAEGSENEATLKRPNKHPNIPLNKSPLLSHSDTDRNTISPDTKKKDTLDRKRSPSPSIPLSKGVHAFLAKSSEEQEDKDMEVSSESAKINDVPVCIAESREIRYSDDVLDMEDTPSIEYVPLEEKLVHSKDGDLERKEIDSAELSRKDKTKANTGIPLVSITVKENAEEETEYEEFDEEFLQTMKENKTAELINRESGKFGTETSPVDPKLSNLDEDGKSIDTNTSKSSEEGFNGADQQSPAVGQKSSSSTEGQQNNEEVDEEFLKKVTAGHNPSNINMKDSSVEVLTVPSGRLTGPEGGITPPIIPFRLRTGPTESSNSSCKSDSENIDKKLGKFKMFQSKRSGGGDEDKQEDMQDNKERKRKKSSFSKFLPGKKNKYRKSKGGDEDMQNSESGSNPSTPETQERHKVRPTRSSEIIQAETRNSKFMSDQDQEISKVTIPQILVQEDTSDKDLLKQVELRHEHLPAREESRCSTYSRTSTNSREADPPPEVPEKRGLRSKSPAHDVPQSNQPVGFVDQTMHEIDTEPEEAREVDGMLSQEQINAILSKSDSRARRRTSSSRNSDGFPGPLDASQTGKMEGSISRRPSKISVTSSESDEPLPKTQFLSSDRHSSSSGSLKNQAKSDDSDGSSETQLAHFKTPEIPPEQESTVILRRPNRLTDSLVNGPRVSLTLPEFTVMEEEGPGTPDSVKAALGTGSGKTPEMEEDEQNDYFPIVGRGVELRTPSPSRLISDSSNAGMRTSGITGLKAFLEENQEDISTTRSAGISRLGHSAAVEKLKRESSEDS